MTFCIGQEFQAKFVLPKRHKGEKWAPPLSNLMKEFTTNNSLIQTKMLQKKSLSLFRLPIFHKHHKLSNIIS